MKDNRFYAISLIANEMLDCYPTSMDIALNDMGKQLTEKLFDEIQKGEKIVFLKNATTNDNHSLNRTELKQEICITDLVRCRDCKYFTEDRTCICKDGGMFEPNIDDYCSYGERKDG